MRAGILFILLGTLSLLGGARNVGHPSTKPLGHHYSVGGKTTIEQDHLISISCIAFGLFATPVGVFMVLRTWKETKRT